MDKSPFFSPSALGFTPADGTGAAPKSLDEIMSSSIFPTPQKSHDSPRMDLNAELNDKSGPFNNIIKSEAPSSSAKAPKTRSSPDWTTVSGLKNVILYVLLYKPHFDLSFSLHKSGHHKKLQLHLLFSRHLWTVSLMQT